MKKNICLLIVTGKLVEDVHIIHLIFFFKKRSINMNRMIKTKTTKNNKFDKL